MSKEQVRIFVKSGKEKHFVTALEQKMFVDGIRLSRTGDIQHIDIGNQDAGVELEIPRAWVPDMVLHMALMLDAEDTITLLKEFEERVR